MARCPVCGTEIEELKSHVGLVLPERCILEDIQLESGRKYMRCIRYAFLPPKRDPLGNYYGACIAIGSLEKEIGGGRSFFNPFKFYLTPEYLQKIHKHTLNTLVLEGLARAYIRWLKDLELEPRPEFEVFNLIDEICHTPREQRILEEIIKNFWNKMMSICP